MTIYISDHPLVKHKTTLLREKHISTKNFRELTNELTQLLLVEATHSLSIVNQPINGWSGTISSPLLENNQPTLVPILRAGLGMLDGALSILPCAKVSIVGFKRNEETLEADYYYQNIVNDINQRLAIIIDPMLATGGTAIATIDLLKQSGCKTIKAVFLVAAPEGINALKAAHPDVELIIGAKDECLNEKGYILPGLGDAGDKIFGTR